MSENAIVAAIEKVKEEIAAGHRASIVIDMDDIPPMDADDIAYHKYFFDRWDD